MDRPGQRMWDYLSWGKVNSGTWEMQRCEQERMIEH